MPLVMNHLIWTQLSPGVLSFIYTSVVASLTLTVPAAIQSLFLWLSKFFWIEVWLWYLLTTPIFSPPKKKKNISKDKDQNPEFAFRIQITDLNVPYEALHRLMHILLQNAFNTTFSLALLALASPNDLHLREHIFSDGGLAHALWFTFSCYLYALIVYQGQDGKSSLPGCEK